MSNNTPLGQPESVGGWQQWKATAAAIFLVLACGTAYANSLVCPFILDDQEAILENNSIRSLKKLKRIFFPPQGGQTVQGRPVLNLTFALNYAWSKTDVWSWHVVNIAIHALGGLCLFGIARRTFQLPRFDDQQRRRATWLAFAIALLWTVHPLQTESVTYIVQRAESLVGLWMLLTLYCAIRAAQSPPGRAWQLAAVLACAAGMATKEVMVAAPLLVVLYDWAFSEESLVGVIRRRWGFYTCLAATWCILGALLFASYDRGGSAGLGQGVTSWEYARTQFGFIAKYLRLSFWPHPLILDYGIPIAREPAEIIVPALLVLALVAGTLAALLRPAWRPLGFLGAWFFCILAPSSSVVPVVTQTGAEHRMYLPLAAVVALLVIAVDRLLNGAARSVSGRRKETDGAVPMSQETPPGVRMLAFAGPALLCVVALILGTLTARRNFDYRSASAIWSDTAAKRPDNYRAFAQLGLAEVATGEIQQAIAHFDRAILLNPRSAASYNSRGDAYLQLGNVEQAQRDFQAGRDIVPRKAEVFVNSGMDRASAGDLEGALAAFTRAVTLAPNAAPLHWHRGVALARLSRPTEAIEEFSEALRLSPDYAEAYRSRALSYIELERFDLARRDLAELRRLGSPYAARLTIQLENGVSSDNASP